MRLQRGASAGRLASVEEFEVPPKHTVGYESIFELYAPESLFVSNACSLKRFQRL